MPDNPQPTTHNKNIILKAENISKQYRLGTVGTGTLSHDFNRWWHRIRGKEDPYLKIGDVNDRSTKGSSDYVWALQDINFEVERGEVLGIIGKNGAGKSTLLKILSKVTAPTTGTIKSRGRIASLLEVGTGFNGELTGRENIYLNGAILGMTKSEITSKLDEIIEFSGCERYIDTPVKRYSSGMTVRLAFAVAAFLEPEILVIDEVLAVGDAEFQKKAIGKMQDISRGEGRTVLFVSHNMAAVKSLCTRGIVLEHGKVVFEGGIEESVQYYLMSENKSEDSRIFTNSKKGSNGIKKIQIQGIDGIHKHEDDILINITFSEINTECRVGVALLNANKTKVFTDVCKINKQNKEIGCKIPGFLLLKGTYSIDVATFSDNVVYDYIEDVCPFQIVDLINDYKIYNGKIGDLKIKCEWNEVER